MRFTLGTAQLGMEYGVANAAGMPDELAARALLERAWELGLRSFDTAAAYGVAEQRLGRFFAEVPRGDIVVTTKIGPNDAPERSLERLRLDRVDHLLLHTPDQPPDALFSAKARSLARSVGVSAYTPAHVRKALATGGLASIQVPLNLLDHRLITSGLLRTLHEQGFTVFARSAFLQGLFALDPKALPTRVAHAAASLRALHDTCAAFGTAPLEAALPWVLQVEAVDSVVVGVDDVEQLEQNVARVKQSVSPALSRALAERFASLDESIIDPSRWGQA